MVNATSSLVLPIIFLVLFSLGEQSMGSKECARILGPCTNHHCDTRCPDISDCDRACKNYFSGHNASGLCDPQVRYNCMCRYDYPCVPPDAVDMTLEDQEDACRYARREKHNFSREQRKLIQVMNVKRKRDFLCLENVNGEMVNILEGLELHTDVFNAVEQKKIVDKVCELQEKARKGELKRAFTPKGKGRSAIQFGCCFNYRTSKAGTPAGILRYETVEPLPALFKVIIRRLVEWHVLPPTCVPDCCVVNIYGEGDCIPPHVDNHDFLRPFCTVSFLSECNILFGSNLKLEDNGEYSGCSYSLPLPVGSVLVLNGNGANVAKHCVPEVPTKRISITFRKMNESKRPIWFTPEPDLQWIQPLQFELESSSSSDHVY